MAQLELAISLSLASSVCTATSSVCQRIGATGLARERGQDDRERRPGRRGPAAGGFDPMLVFRLARRPVWLFGFVGMLAGFGCQVTALHYGPLTLVQPILAVELPLVFGYLVVFSRLAGSYHGGTLAAIRRSLGVTGGPRQASAEPFRPPGEPRSAGSAAARRDVLSAAAMAAGIAVFLAAASPASGHPHASAAAWWLAAVATVTVVALFIAAATTGPSQRGLSWPARSRPGRRPAPGTRSGPSPASRRAALLGIGTGIAWGFVAALIKELSGYLPGGPAVVFTTWSAYALMAAGAATMLLTAHAMTAGPLAASQPGFTICDPVTAILLGVALFGDRLRTTPLALTAEIIAMLAVAVAAHTLARSKLITLPGAGAG